MHGVIHQFLALDVESLLHAMISSIPVQMWENLSFCNG